jgi:hypothetical protein
MHPQSPSENVVIEAVIIPELKLCDIQREVFGTDFVERAGALEDVPEPPQSFECIALNPSVPI